MIGDIQTKIQQLSLMEVDSNIYSKDSQIPKIKNVFENVSIQG